MRWGWWLGLGAVLLAVASLLPTGTVLAQASDVTVSGRLVTADGRPIAGRPVVVTRELTLTDVGDNLAMYFGSLGFAVLTCVTGDPALEICGRHEYLATTDADGRFQVQLAAEDVRDSAGSPRPLSVVAGLPAEQGESDGATVSWYVEPDGSTVELPDVPVWSSGIQAKVGDRNTTYTWRTPPKLPGASDTSTSFGLADDKRGLAVGLSEPSSPVRIDNRALENSTPKATLSGSARIDGVLVSWSSGTVRTEAAGVRPFSRKQPCRAGIGDLPESSYRTCWLVDGDFDAPLADVDPEGKGPRLGGPLPVACRKQRDTWGDLECVRAPVASVTVDLERRRSIGEVVVRANDNNTWSEAVVEASTDRRSWQRVGRISGFDEVGEDVDLGHRRFVVEAPDGIDARYVRIRADDPPGPQDGFVRLGGEPENDPGARVEVFRGDLAGLTELSVWRPRPEPEPEREPAPDPESDAEPARADHAEPSSGIGVGPVMIAGLLGVGLVSAGLVMWGPRARRRG